MADTPTGADQGVSTPNAPIGADPVQSAVGQPAKAPEAIELRDDLLIKDPKTGQPVKYSEFNRTFQSQFTRASQEAAKLRADLAREQQAREQYERQVQQFRQAAGAPAPQEDILAKLKALPYLDGGAAAEMVQAIAGEIQRRDQVVMALGRELLKMREVVGTLNGQYVNQSFDNEIASAVREAGFDPTQDPGVVEIARDIRMSHEGDDLRTELPRLIKERVDQLNKVFEARKQAALAQARRPAFLPGRGGDAKPSKPLELDPKLNARQIADQLWGTWGNNET